MRSEVTDAIQRSFERIQSHYSLTLALPLHTPKAVPVQISTNGASGGKVLAYRTQIAGREK